MCTCMNLGLLTCDIQLRFVGIRTSIRHRHNAAADVFECFDELILKSTAPCAAAAGAFAGWIAALHLTQCFGCS